MKLYLTNIILVSFISAQGQTTSSVEGIIINSENNQPIVGANILIMGTDQGTISDEKGEFILDWHGTYPIKLNITHIAFTSEEREILTGGKYAIRLRPTILEGEEVTITGIRSAADKDVSSSKEIVSLRTVEERGIRDISEVLQEMGGVNIATTTSGRQTVSIRGSNANEVSVYLDGVKLNRAMDGEANLAFVDMSDLANVEVIRGGNTTLFGSGNFGGVILLKSSELDRNYFKVSRSMGLTDASDQDISATLSFKGGPLSFGGNFSGKSRLYDGRTQYTTLFENYSGSFKNNKRIGTIRYIKQDNSLKFASGGVMSSDKMDIKQMNLSGELFHTKGWDFQWGQRNWSWNDNFFTNVERYLRDSTSTLRLSKSFAWRNVNGTVQVEKENQSFKGNQSLQDSYTLKNWIDNAELNQEDLGWVGVIRYQQDYPVKEVDVLRLEFGIRNSESTYSHNQVIEIYDSAVFKDKIHYQFEKKTPLNTFRLGLFASGQLAGGNRYEFFFNQGTNHRTPTLNDRFLWGIGLEKTEDYYDELLRTRPQSPSHQAIHDIKIQNIKSVLSSMKGGLKREYVSTTELSGKISLDQLKTEPFTSWDIGIGIFRNSYLDKIAYRNIPNGLVAPFNTTTAWLNGLEISGRTFAWNNQFQLGINMMWVFPSDATVFPEKPSSRTSMVVDYRYGIFHANLSHLFQGPQKYMRGGVLLDLHKSISNTNLTLSVKKKIWILDFSASYTVRNLFSETSPFVNAGNIAEDGSFNYYDAHRKLITLKVSLVDDKGP